MKKIWPQLKKIGQKIYSFKAKILGRQIPLLLIVTIGVIFIMLTTTFSLWHFQNKQRSENLSDEETTTSASSKYGNLLGPQSTKTLAPCFQDGKSMLARGKPNNKYGMYIVLDSTSMSLEKQIKNIASLVNSNGGDWGYVLIPLRITNYKQEMFSKFFTLTEQYHLIPIIQLLSEKADYALLPRYLESVAQFLDQFSWPASCRFVVIFNEPNSKDYWLDTPEDYAVILNQAIDIFKKQNPNFFILNAGINASARSGPIYLDEEEYLLRMNAKVPNIFSRLDGWSAHSYPQPEFSGDYYNPPSWYGKRDQIKAYEWELELLEKHFGVTNLPVFITETGWAHKEGNQPKWQYKPATLTATYFDDVFRNIWGPDDRIVAITPFVFNLGSFSNFNWMEKNGTCHPQCEVLKNIPKIQGVPE